MHVLPSWFETTGLSSLEAAAMGCNLVITRKGDTEEYFGDMAYYCEPDDISSIREAVLNAYSAPKNPKLKDHILENYTWNKTAEQTLNAYKTVLNTYSFNDQIVGTGEIFDANEGIAEIVDNAKHG